jgi:hypothetical protein
MLLPRAIAVAATLLLMGVAIAAPLRMRYPEGPAHGFLVLEDRPGHAVARGEVRQWLERGVVASRMTLRFGDGSLYDEEVRFTQRPAFRVESYSLAQHGPSFTESLDVKFDKSGHYRARRRSAPDEAEEIDEGRTEIPDDTSNGITSILLKNLPTGQSAVLHVMAFMPKPKVLELHLTPEADDEYWVGSVPTKAVRFRIQPKVTGVTGVVASVLDKQPDPLHMWIAPAPSPVLVKFEGSLYVGGPTWVMQLGAPTWKAR